MEEDNVVQTPDATPDPSPVPDTNPQPDAAAPSEPPSPAPSGAERRIQQLVARQREAERREAARTEEAAYWRGIAEGRTKPASPAQPSPVQSPPGAPTPPVLADFERSEDFEEARTRYVVDKAKWDLKQELETFRARETHAAMNRIYRERMTTAAMTDPELLEIENDATLPVSLPMAIAIKESEGAPSILRYLAAHRDEAARIARLNPIAAAREIGRIEAAATSSPKAQTRTVSQAPAPVHPVGGTRGSVEADDEKAPIEEFIRKRNEAQYGR